MAFLFRAAAAIVIAALSAAPAFAGEAPLTGIQQFKHVVIVIQENRTPDNMFHGLNQLLPQADIADSGVDSLGEEIPLTQVALANSYDLNHSHIAFTQMYDNGRMDGADLIRCSPKPGTSCPQTPQYKFVAPSDVKPYFDIAVNYGFANRMFQSNQGPSYPAHQFLLGGTSAPGPNSVQFAADNPIHGRVDGKPSERTGCIAPPTEQVMLINPQGQEKQLIYPCFEHQTLTDLIDSKEGLSWRYYTPSTGSIWTAPNSIRHMCVPTGSNPPKCNGPDWIGQNKIKLDPADILRDINAHILPSVSWVIPTGLESDHAFFNDGSGPSWVSSVVNAVGRSEYWKDTVVLIVWDDWGGWYDHVMPTLDPVYGYYENGFRVPFLVVSRYTPAGYVSNVTHNFGSILKFVETVFGLPVIPPGTFVDSRADDLTDFFDFTQPPRAFVSIHAPRSEDYFLHDKRPKTDPDDD
jgi:phospholipase C